MAPPSPLFEVQRGVMGCRFGDGSGSGGGGAIAVMRSGLEVLMVSQGRRTTRGGGARTSQEPVPYRWRLTDAPGATADRAGVAQW